MRSWIARIVDAIEAEDHIALDREIGRWVLGGRCKSRADIIVRKLMTFHKNRGDYNRIGLAWERITGSMLVRT